MDSIERGLGARFAVARKAAGMTQEQVAEQIGCSVETIGRLERGSQLPPIGRLDAAAQAVGVDLSDLLRPSKKREPREVAISRLVALLRRRPAEDAELVVAIVEAICRRFP